MSGQETVEPITMDDDLQRLFSSAENGQPEAQYELGRCYYKGLGVCRDFGEARTWFVRSAKQGHVSSLFMVGLIYHLGKGLRRRNPVLAMPGSPLLPTRGVNDQKRDCTTRIPGEMGHVACQYCEGKVLGYRLGSEVWTRIGCVMNKERSMAVRTMLAGLLIVICAAATAQDIDTARQAYENDDYEIALRIFHPLAEGGDARAQFSLGEMYDIGQGVPEDDTEAAKWYRLAAKQGHMDAQFWLANLYEDGSGVPQDHAESAKWYRMAAEQGNSSAMYNLGWMYRYGRDGVPEDHSEFVKWFRLAAEHGELNAQYELGTMYRDGIIVPQDYTEAVKWFRLAADNSPYQRSHQNTHSWFYLGVAYNFGKGVPQDHAEAAKWYRMAADQGYSAAQYNLGVAYANGEGVPQDHAEAVKWYRLAADQGDATAQNNLGAAYASGKGVPQNYAKAVKWHRMAAEQGNSTAQYNLGVAYAKGRGTPQDIVYAHA